MINNFLIKSYSFNDQLLSGNILNKIVETFFSSLKDGEKYFLLLRLEYSSGRIVTLHKGLIISNNEAKEYLQFINNTLSIKSNDYTDNVVSLLTFNYFLIDKKKLGTYQEKWSELLKEVNTVTLEKFGNSTISFFLPLNRDYRSWGTLLAQSKEFLIISSKEHIYKISKIVNGHEIDIFKGKNKIFTFKDKDFHGDIFIRLFLGQKYYIHTLLNKIILRTKEHKTNFLKPLSKSPKKKSKLITIDIETINKDGVLKPYLYCMYDGVKRYSFFNNNPDQLFNALLRRKYKGYTVYAHNLSKFDIIFLFKKLADLKINHGYEVEPIIKDGDIISIKIFNHEKGISITLRDSYLMLTQSLSKLSKTFPCTKVKGIEPVLIMNDSLSLNEKEYAHKDVSHYNKEVQLLYNFNEWKTLIQEYCILDCVVLHEILSQFKDLVYSKWEINIEKFPTISSLSFAIYRTHYLPKDLIPITNKEVFSFIKESYTGGSTDMYIPHGFNLKCYDVNSLYPFVMKDNLYPVGKIQEFHGDINILSQKEDIYWIGDVSVSTKKDLLHPYLQIHSKVNGSLRTVSPNGSFNMKLHMPEYLNALKDYNISIKNGYFFEKADIFSGFVDSLYTLRKSYPKTDPMNLTCKLIMNSLYGRFGMAPIFKKQEFVSREAFNDMLGIEQIFDFLDLEEFGFFVEYLDKYKTSDQHKCSIGIASAVTSYARAFMSKFKNNNNFKLYYSDTDSIFIDKELPSNLIGNEIGQFKLEYIFSEGVFLGPKIYCGVTDSGKYISKVKGYKNHQNITFDDFKSLLKKDALPLELHHDKWFRSLSNGEITIKDQVYNLIKTENKREFIYENDLAINTKAFSIK